MNKTDLVDAPYLRTDLPEFRPGDTVKVHVRVVEAGRERIQVFQGVVIRRQGGGLQETFTVRKISFGVGVERTFPLHSPSIGKLEVVSRGHVRRAKLYYLRERRGKKARIRERRLGDEELAAIAAAEAERAAAAAPPMPVPPMGPTIRSIRRTRPAPARGRRRLRTSRPTRPTLAAAASPGAGRTPGRGVGRRYGPDRALRDRAPGLVGDRAPVGLRGARRRDHTLEASARRAAETWVVPARAPDPARGRAGRRDRPQDLRRPGLLHPLGLDGAHAGTGGPRARPEGGVRSRSRRRHRVLGPAGAPRSGSRDRRRVRPLVVRARSASNGPSTRTSSSG